MFDYWSTRSKYIPAAKYLGYINGDEELAEDLQDLDINGDEPAENGHDLQEVHVIFIPGPSSMY